MFVHTVKMICSRVLVGKVLALGKVSFAVCVMMTHWSLVCFLPRGSSAVVSADLILITPTLRVLFWACYFILIYFLWMFVSRFLSPSFPGIPALVALSV